MALARALSAGDNSRLDLPILPTKEGKVKASAAVVFFFTIARISGDALAPYLQPFAPAAMVLGNVVGCLALLVLSTSSGGRRGWCAR